MTRSSSPAAARLLGRLDLSLPLDLARLPGARERLGAFLGEELVLCAQEALKNAVRHSESPRGVEVEVSVTQTAVALVVRDYGCGLKRADDVLARARARPPDRLAASGRGLYVMSALMDELELSSDGGLEVRMVRR